MDWQPIETAPRAGASFLALVERDQVFIAWRFDLDNAYGGTHCWFGVNQNTYDDGAAAIEPTHWMPLPEPPASGIETEGQDPAEVLGAKHESPTAESGDAQPLEPKD